MKREKLRATCVMYITSSCNLDCEYCYEKNGRPDKSLTREEINDKLTWIDENLADDSHIVIFGGEPLLRIDLIEHIVDKLATVYRDRQFSMSMNTNGILLLNNNIFERYKRIVSTRQFTTVVSYDGPNSFRRKDSNGNCVNDKIVEVLRKLERNGIDYTLSYTWHKENDKTILRDIVYICENFKPSRLEVSINCMEIDRYCSSNRGYEEYTRAYTPYFETIFLEYGIPICEFTCRVCKRCVYNQKNVYIAPGKEEPIVNPKKTNIDFNLWGLSSESLEKRVV